MTIERFYEVENEIKDIISNSFQKAISVSTSDFVLLLARGGYQKQLDNPGIRFSPFVIEESSDFMVDLTRKKFFVRYMNNYVQSLTNDKIYNNEDQEYEITIQLMIYSHIWESHLFLNQLKRLALIQLGRGYEWKSILGNLHNGKSNFMNDHIISKFEKSDERMAELIKKCYIRDLRNDFAHSTYYINNNMIYSNKEGFLSGSSIGFKDWEEIFVHSILLSYHLNDMLLEFRNQFVEIVGDNPISIDIPQKHNNNKKMHVLIKPEKIDNGEEKVRFRFVLNDNLEFTSGFGEKR